MEKKGRTRCPALILGWSISAVLVFAGCANRAEDSASQLEVARLDPVILTAGEFETIIRLLRPQHPGKYQTVDQLANLAKELLTLRALAQRARGDGLADRPDLRYRLDTILRDELIRQEVDAKVEFADVTDADVATYYAAHGDEFEIPRTISIHEIFIPLDGPGATEARSDKRAMAMRLLEKARKATPSVHEFLKLARGVSRDFTKKGNNGRSVTFRGSTVNGKELNADQRLVWEAAKKLNAVGSIAGPIETSKGFHILRLSGNRDEQIRPLESVREEVRYELYKERRQQALDRLIAEVIDPEAPRIDRQVLLRFQSVAMESRISKRGHPPAPPIPGIPRSFENEEGSPLTN